MKPVHSLVMRVITLNVKVHQQTGCQIVISNIFLSIVIFYIVIVGVVVVVGMQSLNQSPINRQEKWLDKKKEEDTMQKWLNS